jgi:hypothetical protein
MAPDPDDDRHGESDAAELQRLREEVGDHRDGGAVLAFCTYPSGATVLGIVLAVVAALALVEVAGWTRPAAVHPSSPAAGSWCVVPAWT